MNDTPSDVTERFSNRVDNYVRYRPGYPSGVLELLRDETGLTADAIVADIGSGTGISSKLFLENGNRVSAIEPNAEMRKAAESQLSGHENYTSIDAPAEDTGLPAMSVNYVVAAQSFHWFDRDAARREFARILDPAGWVVLLWNTRQTSSTAFLRDYESLLLRYGTDYAQVRHENIDTNAIRAFFAGHFSSHQLDNQQNFDLAGVRGRLLSSSYAPTEQSSNFLPMLKELESIFQTHQEDGTISFKYTTEVHFGRVTS